MIWTVFYLAGGFSYMLSLNILYYYLIQFYSIIYYYHCFGQNRGLFDLK